MQYPIPGTRSVRRASAAALLLLAACGGDGVEGRANDTSEANVAEVDQKSSAAATDKELAAFREPADSVLTPEQVNAFEAAMKKAGKSVDVKIYPGAGHAFANVNNPWKGYREEAAKDAWARTVAFFAKHLKKA